MLSDVKAIWTFRHFWLALVRMDLRTRYRRSVIGVGWSVMNPILMSVVIVLGLGKVMSNNASWADFGAFLLPGLCVWEFIRNSTTAGSNALVHNEAYIRQCPLPYGIYPLRTVLGTGVHFLITLGVTILLNCGLYALDGTRDPLLPLRSVWCLPAIVAVLFVFCWGMATLTAFATAYFPDTQHLVEVLASMLFFLTPVMIPPDKLPEVLRAVEPYNPICVYLELIRDPLVRGQVPRAELWGQAGLFAAVAFGLGCVTIGRLQKKVIFQL